MSDLNFSPMLAERSSPASGRAGKDFRTLMLTGNYIADTKLDGVRVLARWDSRALAVVLWNRAKVDVTYRYPDIVEQLKDVLENLGDDFVLDGEVIAKDGRFESTLIRDQQANPTSAAQAAAQYPAVYIAFDLLPIWPKGVEGAGSPKKSFTYVQRRKLLEHFNGLFPDDLKITPISEDPDFLDMTRSMGMEGAVIKTKVGPYVAGRTQAWIKFRNLYRVTCLVSHYTPGQGARKDFGAMELALLGPDGPVSVGRCGTGFKTREIPGLKAMIDNADHSPVIVEIEATNRTKGGTLRFPVFKGVRSDVHPQDCTLDQLESLPSC